MLRPAATLCYCFDLPFAAGCAALASAFGGWSMASMHSSSKSVAEDSCSKAASNRSSTSLTAAAGATDSVLGFAITGSDRSEFLADDAAGGAGFATAAVDVVGDFANAAVATGKRTSATSSSAAVKSGFTAGDATCCDTLADLCIGWPVGAPCLTNGVERSNFTTTPLTRAIGSGSLATFKASSSSSSGTAAFTPAHDIARPATIVPAAMRSSCTAA